MSMANYTFSPDGLNVLFAGDQYSTEVSTERAVERAAELNTGLMRVIANGLPSDAPVPGGALPGEDSQFIPFASPGTTDPDYRAPSSSQQKQPEEASKKDPDNDGDDDSSAAGDTDHDFWTAGGKQKKPLPGKPAKK